MNIFNAFYIGILTLILFVPTVISESLLFPFIAGKNIWFRFFVLLAALLFAYLIYKKRELIKTLTPIHYAFLFFVGVIFIADIQGVNPVRSFFSNFERMEGWFTHGLLLLSFLLLTQTIRSLVLWRNIFKISLIANAYVLFFGFSQYFGKLNLFQQSADRIDATLGNATYLGGYAMMYAFITVWLAYTTKNISARFIYIGIAMLNVFISIATLTRGAALGVIAGILISLALIAIFEKRYIFMRYIGVGMLGLVLVGGFLLFSHKDASIVRQSTILNRIASISTQEHTATSRLLIWNMSFQGFKERPIFGWGQENFLYVFSNHFDPRLAAYEPWYDRSHNVFFDWLIAGGALGLLAYLALFATPIYFMWFARKAKDNFSVIEKSLWTGFLGAYFVFNLFVFDNIASYLLFVFILGYIAWKGTISGKENIISLTKNQMSVVVAILVGIGVFGMYFLVYKPYVSGKALIQGMQYSEVVLNAANDTQVQAWTVDRIGARYTKNELSALAREKFLQATSFTFGRTEAREQLAQRVVPIIRLQDISNEEKKAWAELTFSELEKELTSDPNNVRTLQFAGLLYVQFGKLEEALTFLDKAQTLAPKKQLLILDRALVHQVSGDYEKALEIVKEAYGLNPNFLVARAKYILALYRVGKDADARALEPQFIQDATTQGYELVTSKAYDAQVIAARIDYLGREAVIAYQKGDMASYAKYFNLVKNISPDASSRLAELVKTLK